MHTVVPRGPSRAPRQAKRRVIQLSKPAPHTIVPVVDTHADRREHRVILDARIEAGAHGLYISSVECLHAAAMKLNVLLGHALSLFLAAERRRPTEFQLLHCAEAVARSPRQALKRRPEVGGR